MSEENVEIVRRVYAEWKRGNFAATLLNSGVRIRWLAGLVGDEQPETVGVEDAASFLSEFFAAFDRVTQSAEEIIDAGEKVVAISTWRARGKTSGAPTEWRHGGVWEVRDAKVVSLISYPDPADALKAAGLSE